MENSICKENSCRLSNNLFGSAHIKNRFWAAVKKKYEKTGDTWTAKE